MRRMSRDMFMAEIGTRRDIRQIVNDLGYPTDWLWAWDNYKPTILAAAHEYGLSRHLEIGAGRDPLFSPDELKNFEVTLNDISEFELAQVGPEYRKVKCDIAADHAPDILGRGRYDFAYCRMVMEHVPDVARMWRNIYAVLAPGGMALSFFPTLYAPPFALNRVIPEKLSRPILEFIDRKRVPDGDDPKFLAYYDHCFSDERKLAPMLQDAGFLEITVLPFWGYSYFWKFPVLKQIDATFTRMAQARGWRSVSSFAYVIVRK